MKAPTDISGGVKPGEKMVTGRIELNWENTGHRTLSEKKKVREFCEAHKNTEYHYPVRRG